MSLWGNILIFTLLVSAPAGWGTASPQGTDLHQFYGDESVDKPSKKSNFEQLQESVRQLGEGPTDPNTWNDILALTGELESEPNLTEEQKRFIKETRDKINFLISAHNTKTDELYSTDQNKQNKQTAQDLLDRYQKLKDRLTDSERRVFEKFLSEKLAGLGFGFDSDSGTLFTQIRKYQPGNTGLDFQRYDLGVPPSFTLDAPSSSVGRAMDPNKYSPVNPSSSPLPGVTSDTILNLNENPVLEAPEKIRWDVSSSPSHSVSPSEQASEPEPLSPFVTDPPTQESPLTTVNNTPPSPPRSLPPPSRPDIPIGPNTVEDPRPRAIASESNSPSLSSDHDSPAPSDTPSENGVVRSDSFSPPLISLGAPPTQQASPTLEASTPTDSDGLQLPTDDSKAQPPNSSASNPKDSSSSGSGNSGVPNAGKLSETETLQTETLQTGTLQTGPPSDPGKLAPTGDLREGTLSQPGTLIPSDKESIASGNLKVSEPSKAGELQLGKDPKSGTLDKLGELFSGQDLIASSNLTEIGSLVVTKDSLRLGSLAVGTLASALPSTNGILRAQVVTALVQQALGNLANWRAPRNDEEPTLSESAPRSYEQIAKLLARNFPKKITDPKSKGGGRDLASFLKVD